MEKCNTSAPKEKTTERMHMVAVMTESLESSVSAYCKAKTKKGHSPFVGHDIPREDSKESIKRRITLIREELLNISKEL